MCDKHRPFIQYQDRAIRDFNEAIRVANKRALERGRQRVVRHTGKVFKRGVWFIQDIEAPRHKAEVIE